MNAVGIKPQPRSESVAFVISELILKENSTNSLENKTAKIRSRTCNSADRGNRHSSYFSGNRVSPVEQIYVFKASNFNYVDGSDLAQQYSENGNGRITGSNKINFLQEITKLSQINISRLNNKCSYTVLTGCPTDSTESLLKQHASPPEDSDSGTPTRGSMVKSKSAYAIKKKNFDETSPTDNKNKTKPEQNKKLPREPISVPNFSLLTLPTPVLTPVEAARLVFLDTDEENDDDNQNRVSNNVTQVRSLSSKGTYENFQTVKRGESYSSHLAYADNPLYQHMNNSTNNKTSTYSNVNEVYDENVSSTSDYASIETMNRLSSSSNYSVKTNTQHEDNHKVKTKQNEEGPYGFCNPNYMGPDLKSVLKGQNKYQFSKVINTPDSVMEDCGNGVKSEEEDVLELQNFNGNVTEHTRVLYRHTRRDSKPPKSLEFMAKSKSRASSAGRVERHVHRIERTETIISPTIEPFVPLYMFVFGGKEQGQVTVFQRPLSIWRLKLY